MSEKSTRRDFVKTGCVFMGGTYLTPLGSTRASGEESLGVEIAIASICLDGFGDENFQHTFDIVPRTGIKNIEFNVWYPRNITPEGIESIQKRCHEKGLRPISLQGTSFGGNVIKDVAHKMWHMEQARNLGCRRVKFTGSRRGEQGGLETVIEILKELAPVAEEMDVLIAVENHANNNIENLDDYRQIFDAVDSSHVGMCLDMGHFDGASVDNFAVVEEFAGKVNHVDIKDVVAFGTYKSVPYGMGVTKGEEIIQALLDRGYKGYLVIEQAPPREDLNLTEEMSRIYEIFRQFEK